MVIAILRIDLPKCPCHSYALLLHLTNISCSNNLSAIQALCGRVRKKPLNRLSDETRLIPIFVFHNRSKLAGLWNRRVMFIQTDCGFIQQQKASIDLDSIPVYLETIFLP